MIISKSQKLTLSILDRVYIAILLVIFGGIVLHAPISVGLSTLLPYGELIIKSWKEILMLVAIVLVGSIIRRKKQQAILKEPLMIGIWIYIGLHLLSAIVFIDSLSLQSILAGLLIDLRYIVFFVLVFIAARLYPGFRNIFVKVGIAGALVVVIFAILQVFVLPVDVLKYIGYNINSIVPYLTVDQNHDYIRINSTLRGPNPLGAYAVIVLAGLCAWLMNKKAHIQGKPALIAAVLLLGGIVALWASYSRSALLAAIVAIIIVLIVTVFHKMNRKVWIVGGIAVIAVIGLLYGARDSEFVTNVILHDNPTTGAVETSNDGHISSLQDGLSRMIRQPFGAGVGSTGSASLYGESPLIIENQFLFIAHEVGWVGLLIFLLILSGVLVRLWDRRADWLALAVFASGVGMIIINLLLPAWVDDTISIVWWGLAAVVIGSVHPGYKKAKK